MILNLSKNILQYLWHKIDDNFWFDAKFILSSNFVLILGDAMHMFLIKFATMFPNSKML